MLSIYQTNAIFVVLHFLFNVCTLFAPVFYFSLSCIKNCELRYFNVFKTLYRHLFKYWVT